MLNRSFIRENIDLVEERLRRKGFDFTRDEFLELDQREGKARKEWEELRALRNRTSDEIAKLKKSGQDASSKIQEMRSVSARIKDLDEEINQSSSDVETFLASVPNLPDETVPVGTDETGNRVEREVGVLPSFDFEVRDHVDLGTALGILDT